MTGARETLGTWPKSRLRPSFFKWKTLRVTESFDPRATDPKSNFRVEFHSGFFLLVTALRSASPGDLTNEGGELEKSRAELIQWPTVRKNTTRQKVLNLPSSHLNSSRKHVHIVQSSSANSAVRQITRQNTKAENPISLFQPLSDQHCDKTPSQCRKSPISVPTT